MTEYTAGDLVEAVKGETVTRGRLREDELGLHLWVGDSGRTPENLESYGFTISIVEKAAAVVVLPTEPGWYLDRNGMAWELKEFWNCNRLGMTSRPTLKFEENHAPFTRLEPVSETAKKVLDRVRKVWDNNRLRDLDDIGADFGVEL